MLDDLEQKESCACHHAMGTSHIERAWNKISVKEWEIVEEESK